MERVDPAAQRARGSRRLLPFVKSMASTGPGRWTADVSWMLEALVSDLQGERGVAWLSPVVSSGPPEAAIPRNVSPTFIRTARRWARAALAGRTPSSRSLAGFVIGDRDDPLGVFVIGWDRRRRSNLRHPNHADAFSRFLRVASRHSVAAQHRGRSHRSSTTDIAREMGPRQRSNLCCLRAF